MVYLLMTYLTMLAFIITGMYKHDIHYLQTALLLYIIILTVKWDE